MEIVILVLLGINLLVSIGTAGTLIRVINHLRGNGVDDLPMPSREETGLEDLPKRQVSYRDTFLMNWDGMTPRSKNFDGITYEDEE